MKILTFSSDELTSLTIDAADTLIVLPFIHPKDAKRSAEALSRRANAPGLILCIYDLKREGFISIINKAFKLSLNPYVGYAAEDAFPGRDWLKIALEKLKKTSSSLLAFNDGKWRGNLAAFGLVKRSWAIKNYQGDLFFSQYNKHYADTELTLLAKSDNVFTYDCDSILVEVDWEKDIKPVDPLDKKLFLKRMGNGFDGRISDPKLLGMFS